MILYHNFPQNNSRKAHKKAAPTDAAFFLFAYPLFFMPK